MVNVIVEAKNCVIEKGENAVQIDGEYINDLIVRSLPPDMVAYKPYAAKIYVSIDVELAGLKVKTTGYKKIEGGNKNAGTNNSDSDNESVSRE